MSTDQNVSADSIKKALTIEYDNSVAATFIKYINNKQFDEDTLIIDIQNINNCSVLKHLTQTFPKLFANGEKHKKLSTLLHNALKAASAPNPNIKRFNMNKWRSRHARIENYKYLCVYANGKRTKCLDYIDITNCKIYSDNQSTKEFLIVNAKNKNYEFQCHSISDANHWLLFLQEINNKGPRHSISDEENPPELDFDAMSKCASQLINVVHTPKSTNLRKTFNSFLPNNKIQQESERKGFQQREEYQNSPNAPNAVEYATFAQINADVLSNRISGRLQDTVNIIDVIDQSLQIYYSFFPNAVYKNEENIGKFKAFCIVQFDNDQEQIKDELEANYQSPEDCTLVSFDEDCNDPNKPINHFPLEFAVDESKRDAEIFKVIKHCYIYGKPPKPLLQFEKDDFNYVLQPFNRKSKSMMASINMKAKSDFVRSTESGLWLNADKAHNCMVEIKHLNASLRQLIAISMHTDNHLFKFDFACLLIDAYHRYCIVKEIIFDNNNNKKDGTDDSIFIDNMLNAVDDHKDINAALVAKLQMYIKLEEFDTDAIIDDIDNKSITYYGQSNIYNVLNNNIKIIDIIQQQIYNKLVIQHNQLQQLVYGQIYWNVSHNRNMQIVLKTRKVVSNVEAQLEAAYNVLVKKGETKGIILLINGRVMRYSHHNDAIKELHKQALNDYNDIFFRFMSSNGFYWSLVSAKKKDLKFFKAAFQNFGEQICGPLSLKNVSKINDNIFIFWVYIWCCSKVVKSYMQSGNIAIPLQIDLVIIPNSTDNDACIDNIFERFKSHGQAFQHSACNPTDILSINQTLEHILTKCSNEMKRDADNQNDRIVIIVDRRSRDEYSKYSTDNQRDYDQIFGYKPPNKYAQMDEEHEIINAVWNTSKFLIPPPTNYQHEEDSGAQKNNLFVLSYIIRKKSQFIHLFDQEDIQVDIEDVVWDDIESVLSEGSSPSRSTHMSLRTKTDITGKFSSKVAQYFADILQEHKETATLELVDLFEKVADAIKFVNEMKELKELQTIQTFIMKLLMNRKRDSTVNTYLFYNRGYCRFEPLDLVRILPKFFNLDKIKNYQQMLSVFRTYHDKLWELDDLIWMEYKRLYLQSTNAMNQQISMEKLGTDHKDRYEISKYCKWEKEKQIFEFNNPKKILKIYSLMRMKSQQSLALFRIIKAEKHQITISLSIDLRKFLRWDATPKETINGIMINHIERNEYGSAFKKECGVKKGWFINAVNGYDVCNMDVYIFETILDKIVALKQGYKVRLKRKKKHSAADSNLLPSHARNISLIKQQNRMSISITPITPNSNYNGNVGVAIDIVREEEKMLINDTKARPECMEPRKVEESVHD